MISALECFHHATQCDEKAEDAGDDVDRAALVVQAGRWRKLGDLAKLHEAIDFAQQAEPGGR